MLLLTMNIKTTICLHDVTIGHIYLHEAKKTKRSKYADEYVILYGGLMQESRARENVKQEHHQLI